MEVWFGPEASELKDEPTFRCFRRWFRQGYSRYGYMVLTPTVPPVSTRRSLLRGKASRITGLACQVLSVTDFW